MTGWDNETITMTGWASRTKN